MRQQLGLKLEQKVEVKAEIDVKAQQHLTHKLSDRLWQKLKQPPATKAGANTETNVEAKKGHNN